MPGEYEFTEEGITVRLPPEAKETVLMFKTDSDAFRVKARIKEAWQQRGLEFRYHFGALGKTVDIRPNLADARRVNPPSPAAQSGAPGQAMPPTDPGAST